MKRIKMGGCGEITEKKSRFIANVFDVGSEEAAASYINEVRKKYWDARHNCWAYVIGNNNETQRFSDDGEPSGTAGKPILEVLEGSQIRNCLIVVTRYFGGTLLGTGGLVRAYQAASKAGLEKSKVMDVMSGVKLSVDISYNNVGKMQYICAETKASIIDSLYGENVHMDIVVGQENYSRFNKKVADGFSGLVEPEILGSVNYALDEGGKTEII